MPWACVGGYFFLVELGNLSRYHRSARLALLLNLCHQQKIHTVSIIDVQNN